MDPFFWYLCKILSTALLLGVPQSGGKTSPIPVTTADLSDLEGSNSIVPKVSGLLRRVKRFGCWHNCLIHAKHYTKPESCVDGGKCKCLVDLLGKLHGVACELSGRYPFGQSEQDGVPSATQASGITKLQCNYKACWALDENPGNKGKPLIQQVARVLDGTYIQKKCLCSPKLFVALSDARPQALNHVHQPENYKFALSFQTFPDEDGRCVCRFGRQRIPSDYFKYHDVPDADLAAGSSSSSWERESLGVFHKDMVDFENDETRDVVQCGLSGCRHVILRVSRAHLNASASDAWKKPWYMLELERSRYRPMHRHATETAVVCNLKTCWRVNEENNRPLKNHPAENQNDPLRDSVQLTAQQKKMLLWQRGEVRAEKDPSLYVRCTHGICSWVADRQKSSVEVTERISPGGSEEDEVLPGKDGLCPCHKAYMTYYNWKHRK